MFVGTFLWLVVPLRDPIVSSFWFSVFASVINLLLWIPNRGPVWKYSKAAIEEWDRKMAEEVRDR